MSETERVLLKAPQREGALTVLTLSQKALDASSADQLRAEVERYLAPGSVVLLDLSAVGFVDSAGLAAFLTCARRLKEFDGDLKLCSPSPQVRNLLELVRFHRMVDIFNNLEEGLRAFRGSP